MKSGICGLLPAVGLGVLLAAAPLVAHHAIQAKFDDKKPMTLKGLVTKVDWLNPHVHVFMNVQDGNTVNNWAIELESPVDLQKSGWNRDSLKPGDAITVQGIAAKDGSRQAWGNSVTMTSGGKRILNLTAAVSRPRPSGAAQPKG